jgi:hypothetical protein
MDTNKYTFFSSYKEIYTKNQFNQFHGLYQLFHLNGTKFIERNYHNGKRYGLDKLFTSSSTQIITRKQNKLLGTQITIKHECDYHSDVPRGTSEPKFHNKFYQNVPRGTFAILQNKWNVLYKNLKSYFQFKTKDVPCETWLR